MSTYFTDFSEYSTGSAPSDWAFPWNANDTWTVETASGTYYLYCNDPDSVQCIKWDDIDSDGERQDIEILYLWESSDGQFPMALGRGSGTGSNWYGYMLGGTSSVFRCYKHVNSTTLSTVASATLSFSGNTKYWVRFRVNGTSLKGRVWADGGSEPETWDIDATDSDVSGDGFAGYRISAGNNKTFRVYQNGVGTNGDSAPVAAGSTAVNFTGTIPTLNGQRKETFAAQSPTIASYFSGSETPFVYTIQSGTLPSGLSINSSTGVVSGTPTVTGTATGIVVRATDANSDTANSNSFSIAIAAATVPDLSDLTASNLGDETADLSVDVYF